MIPETRPGTRVRGRIAGSPYTVTITGDRARPTAGDRRIADLVDQFREEEFAVSPSGPVITFDGSPGAVRALLEVETKVETVAAPDGATSEGKAVLAGLRR